MEHVMMVQPMSDDALRLQSVAHFMLYRTVNHLRHIHERRGQDLKVYVERFLSQLLHEVTQNDSALRRCCGGAR